MDRAAIILTLLDPEGGGRSAPSRANVNTRKKSMGGNSDNFCMFLNVYQVRYKPFFMVKNLPFGPGITELVRNALFS